jgi:hypothetical protein
VAYSYVQFIGNGATRNYAFPFPYLDASHIKVRVNGVIAGFSLLNSSTVQITSAPAVGSIIDIRRETPKGESPVNFTDGSVLLEKDLDLQTTFNLFTSQETADALEDALTKDTTGKWDGDGRRISNIGDPVDPQDVVTKAHLGYEYPKVSTVANSIGSVNTVAPSIANVNTVAGSIANTNIVGTNITNVNKVSAIDSDVTKVASIDSRVTTVSANMARVTTVANAIANVNATGYSIANVNTTAQSINNVNTVADSIANVNATGQSIASVNQVASILADVVTVAQNKVDVEVLADEISKIQTVANDLNEAVSEIEVVANNIAKVEIVANNIANVNSAFANAQTATTKASEASTSASNALASAQAADADRIAAELARNRAEGAADATTTNTVIPTQNITANGSTTYTINRSVSYAGSITVEVAGVTQIPLEAYNVVSGNQLVFSEAVPSGLIISVRWLDKESQSGAALALEWATKTGGYVSGSTEYSAKKYAQDTVTTYTQTVTDATAIKNQAIADVTAIKNQAITDTTLIKNTATTEVTAIKSQAVADVTALKNTTDTLQQSASASATASANSATASANSATASQASRVASESARDLSQQYRNEAQAFAAVAGGASNSTPVNFTANGTQVDFTLTTAAQNNQSIIVSVNSVLQDMFDAYSLVNAGSTLRFSEAPVSGARIVVRYM